MRSTDPAPYGVIQNQDNHGANHCHKQAIEIYTGHAMCSEDAEKITSNYGTDDSQYDVQKYAFASLVDQFAAYKSGKQTQHNPCQN